MSQTKWSKEELYVALNLYLKIPFGQIHHNNRYIIHLAELIGRSPSSVSMRLSNFASCDPYHQARGVKGLVAGIPVCKPIWDEYIKDQDKFIYESELILANYEDTTIQDQYEISDDDNSEPRIDETVRSVRVRLTQRVFRKIVLDNYENKCAITKLNMGELLVASHIMPWSVSARHRLNPENGICLSALYDKAFDCGLMSLRDDLSIILSNDLKNMQSEAWYIKYFKDLDGFRVSSGLEYRPSQDFLAYHRDIIFKD